MGDRFEVEGGCKGGMEGVVALFGRIRELSFRSAVNGREPRCPNSSFARQAQETMNTKQAVFTQSRAALILYCWQDGGEFDFVV